MMTRVGQGMSLPRILNSGAKLGITNTVITIDRERDRADHDERIAHRRS